MTMPKGYYDDVDSFLAAGPPSLKSIMKKHGGNGGDVNKLKNERSKLRKNKSAPSSTTTNPPVVRNQRRNSAGGNGRKQGKSTAGSSKEKFDYNLLAEAMQFTDNLKSQSDILMDQQESDHRKDRLAGGSPPRQGNPVHALRRRKSNEKISTTSSENITKGNRDIKNQSSKNTSVYESSSKTNSQKKSSNNKNKQTSQKKRSTNTNAFENGDKVDSNKSEMESMVQNFEKGLELSRLKAELAASQQRMANSTSVISAAASEFYGGEKQKTKKTSSKR
jgi:hypothetical protein